MRVELKVGALVLLAFAAIAFMLTLLTQGTVRLGKSVTYLAIIDDATGLSPRSTVKVAGIGVGEIASVRLVGKKAQLRLQLDPRKIQLYQDASLKLKRVGYLGDKYVELDPGSEELQRLEAGSVIPIASQAIDLDEVAESGGELIEKLNRFFGELQRIDELDELVSSLRRSADNIENVTGGIRRGQGTVGRLLTDEEMADQIESTLSGLESTAESVRETQAYVRLKGAAMAAQSDFRFDLGLGVQIPSGDEILLGGAYRGDGIPGFADSGGELDLNVQYAKALGKLALRAGFFEGTPGGGLEYRLGGGRSRVYGEVYRFSAPGAPQVNAGAEIALGSGFGLWSGGDSLATQEGRSFFIGLLFDHALLRLGKGEAGRKK